MNNKISILHLEDSIHDSELVHSVIKSGGIEHDYFFAINEKNFLSLLETENINLILSDYSLPGYNGNEALKAVREKHSHIPFIFVSGIMGEDAAINAMLNGATDYVLKNKLERLNPAIKRAMREFKLGIERKNAEVALTVSETRYRRLFETAKDGILILDAETGMIKDVNPYLIERLGYSKDEFLEKEIWEIGFLKDIVANYGKFLELQKNEYVRYEDLPLKTADGKQINVEFVSNVYTVYHQNVIQCNIRDITDRKQAEAEIRFHSEVLLNMSEGINMVRISDGVIVYANSRYNKMFGYNIGELLGKNISIVNAPGDKSPEIIANEIISQLSQTGFWKGQVHNIRKDGSTFWCHANVTIFKHSQFGEVCISVHEDITEQKKAVDALVESEEKFRSYIENAPDGIFIVDNTGRFINTNKAGFNILGYSNDEINKLATRDLVAEESLEDGLAHFKKIIETGKAVSDLLHKHKDGSKRWLTVNAVKLSENRILGFVRDITERRQIEDALRESEKRFRLLFNSGRDAIAVHKMKKDGQPTNFTQVNAVTCEKLGYSMEEMLKLSPKDIDAPERSGMMPEIIDLLKKNKQVLFETEHVAKDGHRIPVEVSTVLFQIDNEQATMSVARDITDRKQAEKLAQINYSIQSTLNSILKLSIEEIPLIELLKQTLDKVLDIPNFDFESKGSIFLLNNDTRELERIVEKNLSEPLKKTCKSVKFGFCHCGRAASTQKIQFSECLDKKHDITYEGIENHGEYCTPIVYRGITLGVINVELKPNHLKNQIEIDFLYAIANTLAGIIVRKNNEMELKTTLDNLELTVIQRTDELNKKNSELREEIEVRINIENELSISEEKFRSHIEDAADAIFQGNKKGDFIRTNNASFLLTGYSGEELLKMNMLDLVPEVSKSEPSRLYLLEQGKTLHEEQVLIRKDKSEIPIEIKTKKMIDGTYQAIIRNVTERKIAEEKLKKSETSLKEAQQIAKMGNWEYDIINHKMIWSDNCYAILGLLSSEIVLTWDQLKNKVHPDDLHILDEGYKALTNNKAQKKIEVRIILNDGKIKWIENKFALTSKDDKFLKIKGVIIDITEHKQAEKELRKLNKAVESSGEVVFMTDKDGVITFVNSEFTVVYGYSVDEVIGKVTPRILKSGIMETKDYEAFWQALMNKHTIKGELINKTKDGKLIQVESSTNPIFGESGDLIGFLAIQRDITERKKIEEDLANAKKSAEDANRMKSEFLANMSHEIRTPLNAIVGFSSILKEKTDGQKVFTEYLDNIIQSSNVLLNLINDILDLSKVESGRMVINNQPVNINNIIHELQSVFLMKANEKGLSINIQISKNIPESLITDEKYLRQILFNLIGNAVKFTHKGSVDVIVNIIPKDKAGSKIDLIINVKDTGIGIPANQLKIIFDPFIQVSQNSRGKYGGTGLGLSITKRLVELMGGTISVESIIDQGSVFSVSLFNIEISLLNIDENKNQNNKKLLNIKFNNPVILIAEDMLSNRKIIKGYLETFNITIIETENGEECISAIRKQRPDLILMDIQMPVMDGYTAINIIKSDNEWKDIPIIVLTASGMKQQKDQIQKVADDFLIKPIYKNELIKMLIKYLPYEKQPDINNEQEKLTINNRVDLSKLKLSKKNKEELVVKFLPLITKLQEAINIDELQDFIKKLEKFNTQPKIAAITDFCNDLTTHTNSFNIEEIRKDLKYLSEIINK